MKAIEALKAEHRQHGQVEWIGLSSSHRGVINVVSSADAETGTGLIGDHHATKGKSKRQITLIQHEHLAVVAGLLRVDEIRPEDLRRNLVISGINLIALKDQTFRVGNVLLQGTGPCAPCSRMTENLGPGGYNAMRGHGGITTRVLEPGTIRVGDQVVPEPAAGHSEDSTRQKNLFS